MKATTAKALGDLVAQMGALAEDMNHTAAGIAPKPATRAAEILAAYRNGERAPVEGPFTYVEALALVRLNERLLTALRDIVSVPSGTGAKALRAYTKAHYNACAAIAEAEAE